MSGKKKRTARGEQLREQLAKLLRLVKDEDLEEVAGRIVHLIAKGTEEQQKRH